MLLTTAYQQAFWECKDNGNNRIKNNYSWEFITKQYENTFLEEKGY